MIDDLVAFDEDIFSDAVLADPLPTYRRLQDLGAVVWLKRHQVFAVTRYAECRQMLRDPDTFISGEGVGLNDVCNQMTKGSALGSDRPLHPLVKAVWVKYFEPEALQRRRPAMQEQADKLIDALVDHGPFDAVPDLTQAFPMSVVCDMVGIPHEDRHNILPWAAATFDFFGPDNERTRVAGPISKTAFGYGFHPDLPSRILPGSFGAEIFASADRGEITPQAASLMIMGFLSAALDTTISSLQHLVRFLADSPDQYELLRQNPSLATSAYEEALRLGTPIRGFARVASCDTLLGDVQVQRGQRLFVVYAMANRDPRRWPDPDRFDIKRAASGHLAFGHGIHLCAGAPLARLEAGVLLNSLIRKVSRLEKGEGTPALNNFIQAYEHLPLTMHS